MNKTYWHAAFFQTHQFFSTFLQLYFPIGVSFGRKHKK